MRVINHQLENAENADKDLERILKYKAGAIFRLGQLLGGNDNLLEIWNDYKDIIRSNECM
jgi:hypothetical protein